MNAQDGETVEVDITAECAGLLRELAGKDADELVLRGIAFLLDEGTEEEDEDIGRHLVRTRAMFWAMLRDAVVARRKLLRLQEEHEREAAETPGLERRYRAMLARKDGNSG